MTTMMIALIGEQPLPNLLPVRHYRPSDVLFIYTKRTKQVYDRLKATLQQEASVSGLETDAYDIVAIVEALDKQLERRPELASQPAVFNLTGGTKAMALAAYQVAQQRNAPVLYLQSEGKHSRVYHYTWEHQKLQASSNELLPGCATLRDLFDLHFGPGEWQELGPGRHEGSPFEVALSETLRLHGYETMLGVRAMNGQIDIDVAARFENQFGIIEAKMGEKGRRLDGIKQLSTAARHLGTYTQSFYAITVPPESAHEAITIAARIQVISLPGYVRGAATLTHDDEMKLVSIVEKALKG